MHQQPERPHDIEQGPGAHQTPATTSARQEARHADRTATTAAEAVPPLLEDQHALDVDDLVTMHAMFRVALAEDPPAFGSKAWQDLDEHDPRRTAGAVVAAFCWWAAERGLGAPASRERLEQLVTEETARAHIETASAISEALAEQRDYRTRQAALEVAVAPAISYPPRYVA